MIGGTVRRVSRPGALATLAGLSADQGSAW